MPKLRLIERQGINRSKSGTCSSQLSVLKASSCHWAVIDPEKGSMHRALVWRIGFDFLHSIDSQTMPVLSEGVIDG